MSHKKTQADNEMNSKEYRAMTQKQREAVNDSSKNLEEKKKAVEEAGKEVKKGDNAHQGHIEPERLIFNTADNTAEQYDMAKGSPAEPELQEKPDAHSDKEGTIVDADGEGSTADYGNYQTGNPDDEESKEDSKSKKKKDK